MRISDWSSDVCSSDLTATQNRLLSLLLNAAQGFVEITSILAYVIGVSGITDIDEEVGNVPVLIEVLPRTKVHAAVRSEERRVGKECVSTCRSRWSSEN